VLGVGIAVIGIRRARVRRLLGVLPITFVVGFAISRWSVLELPGATMVAIANNGLLTVLVWWAFEQLLRLKARGFLPDELLHVVFCWLVLTAFVALFARSEWPPRLLWMILLPGAFSTATLVAALHHGSSRARADPPKRLLLLRVFGHPRDRQRLLDVLHDSWGRVGTIDLVVGVDVAARTLNALALQDFLLGRIARQIIASRTHLIARVAQADHVLALDGRYATHEFLCLPAVWQETVALLADAADVVLLDFRGFQRRNQGAAFELSLVVQRVPLARIVLLIDAKTDINEIAAIMHVARSRLAADSPNFGAPDASLTVMHSSKWSEDADAVVSRVFGAAYCASAG
jgi:hypothetical protein